MTSSMIMRDDERTENAVHAARPLRIVILVGGLDVGGAERQAITLAHGLRQNDHSVTLASLSDGPLRESATELGVPVRILTGADYWSPMAIPSLIRLMRETQADVVYAFLEVQWLLALAARIGAPKTKIVLGLRTSQYDAASAHTRGRIVRALARRVAHRADLLIANSNAGLADFKRDAGSTTRAVHHGTVVGNGIDTTVFRPEPTARVEIRRTWNIAGDALVVGHVGRLDPVKDHELLLRAFAQLVQQRANASIDSRRLHLVCVGDATASRLDALKDLAQRIGVAEHVTWAGRRADVTSVYSAFDVLALSSLREGFPNVVAEAMACGIPAVVTDTGASAAVVADLGEVVPVGDVAALAVGLQRLLDRRSSQLSVACRDRIEQNFSVDLCAQNTIAALYALFPNGAV